MSRWKGGRRREPRSDQRAEEGQNCPGNFLFNKWGGGKEGGGGKTDRGKQNAGTGLVERVPWEQTV